MKLHFFEWMPRDKKNNPSLLVFLHGMGGTGHIWRPIAANLEDEFLCIAPDQRGHGQSRNVPQNESNSFHAQDYAQDVIQTLHEVVQKHAPSQILLIGHSMGSRTALATAVKIIETEKNLIKLLKGVISVDIGLQSQWGGGIGEPLARFIQELPESFSSRETMKTHLFSKCPDPAIAQYLSAVAKNMAQTGEDWKFPFDHSALVKTIRQANETPIENWVRTILNSGIPILALRGENSKVWLKKDYEHSQKELAHPLLTFEEWEKCGHGLPFEQRAKFVERVRNVTSNP